MTRSRLLFASLLAFAVPACSKSETQQIKADACACKDAACAKGVAMRYEAVVDANWKKGGGASKDDMEAMSGAEACLDKLLSPGAKTDDKAAAKTDDKPAAAASTRFTATDGRFSIQPPTADAPAFKDMPDPNGGTWHHAAWNTPTGLFAVEDRTYTSPEEAKAETAGFIPTRTKEDVSVDKEVTIAGHPGRELVWKLGDLQLHVRFIIDGATVWKVMAGGKGSEPAGSAEFLDSFALSAPAK